MISIIPELLAKLTIVLAAGLVAVTLMRSSSPSVRHLVLLATLACGLTLPMAIALSPSWEVPVLPQSAVSFSSIGSPTSALPNAGDTRPAQPVAPRVLAATPVAASRVAPNSRGLETNLIPLLWAVGFLATVAWLVIGRLRLRRIARRAWPLSGADWVGILAEGRAEAGVRRAVRLCSSPVVSTPLTWGWLSPIILLPEDAPEWADEHRRIVLRHELAHIARTDSLTQVAVGIVCAMYWFHPLVWVAERRLRAECERACDDRVVSLGTSPIDYASHLLEVARSARAFGAAGFLSVAMARPSQLEGRLLSVLNDGRKSVSSSRVARYATIVVPLLVLLPLAAFRPVSKASDIKMSAKSVNAPATATGELLATTPVRAQAVKSPATVPSNRQTPAQSYTDQNADSSFQLSAPVRSAGTLELDLKTGGAVTITSWDTPEVQVRVALRGRDWRDTRVSLRPSDGGAILESDYATSSGNQRSSDQFVIQVPRSFNVRIRSAGGSVSIENVAGRFAGNTGGGEITIRNANGDVDLHTGGGEIHVSNSNLNGSVSTGGGLVRITGVNGSLRGASGSGPVIYTDSEDPRRVSATGVGVGSGSGTSVGEGGISTTTVTSVTGRQTTTSGADDRTGKDYGYARGAIRMSAAGGPLSLPSAPQGARVTTGGGYIRIGPSGGEVYAQTGGGPIDIGPASGSVAAHTGAGDVNVELTGSRPHNVDVTSGTGRVVLVVPSDLNATLELESAYTENLGRKTRIVGDWPLTVTETSDWDASHGTPRKYVRVRQTLGRGGAVIRVRTVNGDIELKRQ